MSTCVSLIMPKALNRVQHDEILKMLMNVDLYGKDIMSDLEPVLGPYSLYKNRECDE